MEVATKRSHGTKLRNFPPNTAMSVFRLSLIFIARPLLVCVLCLLGCRAWTQAPPATQPAEPRGSSGRAPVTLTITKPEHPVELMEGWKLNVTVENVSDELVGLKELRWVVPPQLVSTRPMGESAATAWDTRNYMPGLGLAPGQKLSVQLEMPSVRAAGGQWYLMPSILSWKYRELPITVQLSYSQGKGDASLSETFKVQWLTPFRTMVVGGFLGALLAMAFYYLYLRLWVVTSYFKERKFPSAVGSPAEAIAARQQILDGLKVALRLTQPEHFHIALRQMLTAGVTVIIVLLLLASGNQSLLPISVTVNDFVGAAFMGLVAHKIGKVTFDSIFGLERSGPPPHIDAPIPADAELPLTGAWDAAEAKGRLTWSPRPDAAGYDLHHVATPDEAVGPANLIQSFTSTDPGEALVTQGLANAGDEALFVLVEKQRDGTTRLSKPIAIKRA